MTRAQEQAASAARRACLAWLRSTTDKRESSVAAVANYERYMQSICLSSEVIRSTYLAAWRTTWENA